MTATSDREQMAYISSQAADARVNVELDTGDMTLNIGLNTRPLTELCVSPVSLMVNKLFALNQ